MERQFPKLDVAGSSVRSFGVSYRLVAANVRDPKTGTLHVKVSISSAEDPPWPPNEAPDDE
jgi:hypothetical protein